MTDFVEGDWVMYEPVYNSKLVTVFIDVNGVSVNYPHA
jgi:hypothetical protein